MKKFWFILIDIVCFVGGTFLTLFFLIKGIVENFQNMERTSEGYIMRYDYSTIIFIVGGVCFIVIGFLFKTWRKEFKKD
jgi:hypothetical protein